jgi:hypothetical protein
MSDSPALRIAMAYHEAWVGQDLDTAMTYIADDIVCDAPAGRVEGAVAYRAFLAPFVEMLLGAELIAAYGDDERALVMYDTRTTLVPSGPAAECVTVHNGRISYSRFIFDRVPFAAARQAAAKPGPGSA